MLAATSPRTSSVARIAVSSGARSQIGLFLLAYLVYSAARWLMAGDLASAQDHAAWIVDLEKNLGVDSEASVQDALTGTWALWLLNHAYIAAQLIVVPGVLIFLYRRSQRDLPAAAQHDPRHLADLGARSTRCSPSRRRGSPTWAWSTRSPSRPASRWTRT